MDVQMQLISHPGPNPAASDLAKFTSLLASVFLPAE